MTYRRVKTLTATGISLALAPLFGSLAIAAPVVPSPQIRAALAGLVFVLLLAARDRLLRSLDGRVRQKRFISGDTRFLSAFVDRVRVSFSVQDLVDAARDSLELPADASIVLIRGSDWEILYQSPAALSSNPLTLGTLERNYRDPGDGLWYLDGEFGLLSGAENARGLLVSERGFRFFVFTRLAPRFEPETIGELRDELRACFDRIAVIERLFTIASLSREWELVAETQRSFLPKAMPALAHLELVPYFRPLVNVSGDYYDAVAIDDKRTLLVLGDVSGKGLAAALVMGIVINTIRVARDPSDLVALVRAVHEAIIDMHFEDKYTVLFLGLVDAEKRTLRYINASMPDAIVVSRGVMGPVIKRLGSTMGLVGILPIDEVPVEELELRSGDTILIASDGLTEVPDDSGTQLGEAEVFESLMKKALTMQAQDLVERLAALVSAFAGKRSLRDDVTMLVAKVGNLWS